MTLIEFIKLGIINSDVKAEEFAAELVEKWHEDRIPGELRDVLGLTPREYQAWTTGGVSLLTIAHWHQTCHPPLDVNKPWFKLSGKPGREVVGYLDSARIRSAARKRRRNAKNTVQKPRTARKS